MVNAAVMVERVVSGYCQYLYRWQGCTLPIPVSVKLHLGYFGSHRFTALERVSVLFANAPMTGWSAAM